MERSAGIRRPGPWAQVDMGTGRDYGGWALGLGLFVLVSLGTGGCAGLGAGSEESAESRALVGDDDAGYRETESVALAATHALRRRNYRVAIPLYEELAYREPADPAHQLAIGYAHIQLNSWSEARRAFEEALRLDPSSPEAHLGLGISRYKVDDLLGAQEVLQRGLDTFSPGSERDGWATLVARQLPGVILE